MQLLQMWSSVSYMYNGTAISQMYDFCEPRFGSPINIYFKHNRKDYMGTLILFPLGKTLIGATPRGRALHVYSRKFTNFAPPPTLT